MNRVFRIALILFVVLFIASCSESTGGLTEEESGSNEELDLPFTPEGLLFYEIIDGKITVTDCTNASISEIVIPDGVEVIGENAFYGALMDKVVIPDSVTTIGDNAFYFCQNLKEINIPESVTAIGNGAFSSCWELASMKIPESIKEIGNSAFSDCKALTKVELPNGLVFIRR